MDVAVISTIRVTSTIAAVGGIGVAVGGLLHDVSPTNKTKNQRYEFFITPPFIHFIR
jgi:hypothetical protein